MIVSCGWFWITFSAKWLKYDCVFQLGSSVLMCLYVFFFFSLWLDLLVRLVSVDLHTFGPDALTAVRLIEHQANADQAAEVRPQLVEQVPAAVQGAPAPGECLYSLS